MHDLYEPYEYPGPAEMENGQAKHPHRVGVWTMAAALILAGCLGTAALLLPRYSFVFCLRFTPMILLMLGLELLWAQRKRGTGRIQASGKAIVVCTVLLLVGGVLGTVLPAVQYEDLSYQVRWRLEDELRDSSYDALHPLGVIRADFMVDFQGRPCWPDMTTEDLEPGQLKYATLELRGPYASREEFAEGAAAVLNALEEQDLCAGSIYIEGSGTQEGSRYRVHGNGRYALSAQAEDLYEEIYYYAGNELE